MSGSPLSGDSHGGLAMTTERDDSRLPSRTPLRPADASVVVLDPIVSY